MEERCLTYRFRGPRGDAEEGSIGNADMEAVFEDKGSFTQSGAYGEPHMAHDGNEFEAEGT